MSRSVNQVKGILFTLVVVLHLDGMALDRNTSLLFQVHIVKHLPFGYLDGFCKLQQTVGQGRFPVVYMCYNAKITDILHLRHLNFAQIYKNSLIYG